jgi:hypothetical protein
MGARDSFGLDFDFDLRSLEKDRLGVCVPSSPDIEFIRCANRSLAASNKKKLGVWDCIIELHE